MNTATTLEANFDGLVGPTHNYAGLSFGNDLRGGGSMLNSIPEVEILSVNLVGVAQGKGPFQHVFQFPNVSREVIFSKSFDSRWC